MIAKLRHFIPPKIILQIYNSLITPYISYAKVVLSSADKCHLNKILTLQKRVLRFMYFLGGRDHAILLFLNADILPVTFLYYENICCLMHDVCYERVPKNIIDLFAYTKIVHSYNTRASASRNFYIKHSKIQIQFKAFSRFGGRTWNEIPTFFKRKTQETI